MNRPHIFYKYNRIGHSHLIFELSLNYRFIPIPAFMFNVLGLNLTV